MASHRSRRQAGIRLVVLIGILAVGAALRFHGLGAKSLWLDEAATLYAVDAPLGEVLKAVRANDAHPPLYYAALHAWMLGSRDAARARALSAVVSLATLLVFYSLARVLLPVAGALTATLVLALSAFHVYFAQEARHYALAAFFVTVSWWFLVQLVAGRRLERWPAWLGLALANTLALYTFYYSAFSVVAQGAVLLLLWRGIGRKLIVPWLAWQALPVVVFGLYAAEVIPARLAALRGLTPPAAYTVLSAEGLSATAGQFACGFLGALTKLGGGPHALVGAAAAALGVLALGAGLLGLRGLRTATVVALAWLLGPVVLLALLPIRGHTYEPKHLIFASPALALLVGVGLGAAGRRLKPLVVGLVVLLVAANAASLVRYFSPRVEKENWRDLIARVVERVEPGDIVVFNPWYVELPFLHYYGHVHHGPPVVPVRAPVAGRPFRAGELKLGRRVWVLEAVSHIAIPNPEVTRALESYPLLFHSGDDAGASGRYEGLVGRIRAMLFDTFQPPAGKPPASP